MSDFYQRKHPVTDERYDPKIAVRYTEIPTFMRAPLATDMADVDIALVGVPFDSGVTNRTGARHGPREMRNQSSLSRDIHHVSALTRTDLRASPTLAMCDCQRPTSSNAACMTSTPFMRRCMHTLAYR
jgi:arginase family enzyme